MSKKLLIIDRDGTIIKEPKDNYQVDSFQKLEFCEGAIFYLSRIAKDLEYTLIMATNQDGLGTSSFQKQDFLQPHHFILTLLKNEDVHFENVFIDSSFEKDNSPNRKPRTGMFLNYMKEDIDWANSVVVGDRLTDLELAKNLSAKGIFYSPKQEKVPNGLQEVCICKTDSWATIFDTLSVSHRKISFSRKTKETDITIELNLDGRGKYAITTGLSFFNHMLEQFAKHSMIDIKIEAKGDLHIDEHHTIEDVALTLGEAIFKALGKKKGIERYGFCLPMDDSLVLCALDFGGRPYINWEVDFQREKIGDMPTEMFYHFFKSFSERLQANIFIKAKGKNEHHKIEAIFKAVAKSIKMAKKKTPFVSDLPTTKGIF